MKGVVVKDPASGEKIRLMPGSLSLELYELTKGAKGAKIDESGSSPKLRYEQHMRELHAKYLEEIGKK